MAITHFVTHRIYKQAESDVTLELRAEEAQIDQQVESFAAALKRAYQSRASREHGRFGSDVEGAVLETLIQPLLADESAFLNMSEQFAQQLKQALDNKQLELDGHLIMMREVALDLEVLYLFITNYKESIAINNHLNVEPIQYVDLGASLLALKVDVSLVRQGMSDFYLSVTTPRSNKELVEVFRSLSGFSDALDKEKETQSFLQNVETFAKQVPEEQVNTFKTQVVDYCIERDKLDEPVEFVALSHAVDGINADAFVDALSAGGDGGDAQTAVRVDRGSLKRYSKFSGREKDVAVSFSPELLGDRVKYDIDTDTLTLTGIPKLLRRQLKEYINGR